MYTPRHIQRSALAFGLGFALLASTLGGTAGAQPIDQAQTGAQPSQDLRSPDTRDAAQTSSLAGTTSKNQDLRSPDARDAAERPPTPGPVFWSYPKDPAPQGQPPVFPTYERPAVEAIPADDTGGIDWAPLALGLAAGLTVTGIAVLMARRRPRLRAGV